MFQRVNDSNGSAVFLSLFFTALVGGIIALFMFGIPPYKG